MPFVGPVVVEEIDDVDEGSRWRLVEPLTYDGHSERFVVPVGFTTDFASVPRIFTWLVPRYGRYTKAVILHDYLWSMARAGGFAWVDADGILRRTMRELGVAFLRRWLMWAAVRLASIVRHDPASLWRQGAGPLAALVAVTVPAVAFLAAPAVVVLVFQLLFGLAELVAWALLALTAALRGPGRKQLNPPRLTVPR